MRQIIEENELNEVSGGVVVFSSEKCNVSFTSSKEQYPLILKEGETWKTVRNYAEDLKDSNPQMSDAAFDAFVKKALKDEGWISY